LQGKPWRLIRENQGMSLGSLLLSKVVVETRKEV
jgi:hypothetical protein